MPQTSVFSSFSELCKPHWSRKQHHKHRDQACTTQKAQRAKLST